MSMTMELRDMLDAHGIEVTLHRPMTRDELARENRELRELVRDMGELLDVLTECDLACKHYHDGCIGDCYYVNARRELGIEVN